MEEKRAQPPVFGSLLRRLRISAGLTQELLAERARISVQAVSSLERGARHAPRADTLEMLADTLGLRDEERASFEAAARSSQKPRVRTQPVALRAVRSAERIPGAPIFSTAFIGHARELTDVIGGIEKGVCLTLWGTGGVGKTRLAVQMLDSVRDAFERVCFVQLAATVDDGGMIDAVAAAAGIIPTPEIELFDQIASTFEAERTLLVLDNCEHLITSASRFVASLLVEVPALAIVCTSREPLRIERERVVPIEPLADDDAVRLFIDRASSVVGPQSASRADLDGIGAICRRLDGIPFALELAAACVRSLDIERIASGLDERFRLLTRGNRADLRQATLRATIEWSYDLLSSAERIVLERVGWINGWFDFDDAVAIAVDGAIDPSEVMLAIAALVDKALVVVERRGLSDLRYRLLESTRAFVHQLTSEERADPSPQGAQRRFGRYLLEAVNEAAAASTEDGDRSKLQAISIDHLRGFLRWSIDEARDAELGAAVAARFTYGWDIRGLASEGVRWTERGLALVSPESADVALRLQALIGLSRAYTGLYRHRAAEARALEAYDLARKAGDIAYIGWSANLIALCRNVLGEPGAIEYARESLAAFQKIGDATQLANAHSTIAMVAYLDHRDDAALEMFREAVRRRERLGNRRATASARMDLAEAEFGLGNVALAIAAIDATISEYRTQHSPSNLALALVNRASYLLHDDSIEEARASAFEALEIIRVRDDARGVALTVQVCATIAAIENSHVRASAQLLGYVSEASGTFSEVHEFTELSVNDRLRRSLSTQLEPEILAEEIERGRTLDPHAAIALAFACAGRSLPRDA